jgi:UDP-N-acetylmuramyl pentapeptide phosphotransferase/UDP-N-acetylglucosamine-1-phosphate transferase
MIIKERKKFLVGLIGLATFLITLSFWLFPVIDHRRGLEWADELFNQLTKNSAYIFYTIWYGFSIMYLFEGLGIGATKAAEKKET